MTSIRLILFAACDLIIVLRRRPESACILDDRLEMAFLFLQARVASRTALAR